MSICIDCEKYKNNEHCNDDIGFCEYQLAEHDKKIVSDALDDLEDEVSRGLWEYDKEGYDDLIRIVMDATNRVKAKCNNLLKERTE